MSNNEVSWDSVKKHTTAGDLGRDTAVDLPPVGFHGLVMSRHETV